MPKRSACFIVANSSALRISALVGMQPTFRHTPPRYSFSIHTTLAPSWAARMAATYPPGPAPMTATSFSIMVCFLWYGSRVPLQEIDGEGVELVGELDVRAVPGGREDLQLRARDFGVQVLPAAGLAQQVLVAAADEHRHFDVGRIGPF